MSCSEGGFVPLPLVVAPEKGTIRVSTARIVPFTERGRPERA
jgi:hypothetical protein